MKYITTGVPGNELANELTNDSRIKVLGIIDDAVEVEISAANIDAVADDYCAIIADSMDELM